MKALVAAALALGLLAAAALVLDFETPALGRAVTDRIRDTTGLGCEPESARFHLVRGLSLERLRCSSDLGIGGYEVQLERMVLEHRPLALLRGTVSLRAIVLGKPRFTIRLGTRSSEARPPSHSSKASPPEKPAETAPLEGLALDVELVPDLIRIEEGGLVLGDGFSIQGLDLSLEELAYDRRALTPLHALSSEGPMAIGEIVFDSVALRDVTTNLSARGGRFRLTALRLASDRGTLGGELEVDFNSIPFRYDTALTGELQVASLSGALRLEADGFGTAKENARGSGTFALGAGKFPDAPWVRDIEPVLVGRAFSPAEIPFELREGTLSFDPFELDSPPYSLEIAGPLALDGSTLPRFNLRRGEGSEAPRSAPREARTGTAPRRE